MADKVIASAVVELRADNTKLDAGLNEAKAKVDAASKEMGAKTANAVGTNATPAQQQEQVATAVEKTNAGLARQLGTVNLIRQGFSYILGSVALIATAAEGLYQVFGKSWADAETRGLQAVSAIYDKLKDVRTEVDKIGQGIEDGFNPPDELVQLQRQVDDLRRKAAASSTEFVDTLKEEDTGPLGIFKKVYDSFFGLDKLKKEVDQANVRAVQAQVEATIKLLDVKKQLLAVAIEDYKVQQLGEAGDAVLRKLAIDGANERLRIEKEIGRIQEQAVQRTAASIERLANLLNDNQMLSTLDSIYGEVSLIGGANGGVQVY